MGECSEKYIIGEAEEIMHAEGPKKALEFLEGRAGQKAPKGMCVCESERDKKLIILGSCCEDKDAVRAFFSRLGLGGSISSYSELKAQCNGNYARSE